MYLELRDNLHIENLRFGCYILTGSHPAITTQKIGWNNDVKYIRKCSPTANEVSVNRITVKLLYEYFELDNMGVEPPRRCEKCWGCKDCSFCGHMLSQQEQYEYQAIESKVRYNPLTQSFVVNYPFAGDPSILPDNKGQVSKIHQRLEKKLQKTHFLDEFNQEFNKVLDNGSLVKLSPQKIVMWDGVAYYISLQDVQNEDSDTTHLLIVSNSSLSYCKGLSLNSILMKGPNTLPDQ